MSEKTQEEKAKQRRMNPYHSKRNDYGYCVMFGEKVIKICHSELEALVLMEILNQGYNQALKDRDNL